MSRRWLLALVPLATGCLLSTNLSDLSAGAGGDAGDGGASSSSSSGSTSSSGGEGGTGDDGGGTGTGRLGSLVVTSDRVLNAYASVATNVAAGANAVAVDDATAFGSDDAVLVWQTTGLTQSTSGDTADVDIAKTPVGRFEIARIASKSGNTLALAGALGAAYSAVTAQVVRVPEHQDLTINAGVTVRATPWDGRKGGVVALLLTGTLHNEGTISVDAAGFRGARGWTRPGGSLTNCPTLDGTPTDGHAAKGEGPWVAGFTATASGNAVGGRGNFANAGGGGNCHNSGGGGGGHGGAGGRGGRSGTFTSESLVGGYGGTTLTYDPLARLVFGGGGGTGDSDSSTGGAAVDGGSGGGVVFIRANAMDGKGTISANGATPATIQGNGGGGGGAGGLVVVDLLEGGACSSLRANGGNGSTIDGNDLGTTGGGGGGRVLLRSKTAACPLSAAAGRAGPQNNAGAMDGPAHGATDGAVGVTTALPR